MSALAQTTWRAEPGLAGGSCLRVAGAELLADASGALYYPAARVLVVADLHFEKGSAFAGRGVFLPPYDSAATLQRLAVVLDKYAPRYLVALGDSFHDVRAAERMQASDHERLKSLQDQCEWIWIAGNHDPVPPQGLGGAARAAWQSGPLVFRHEPQAGPSPGEIAGHLHPVAKVAARGTSMRRRCFVSDGTRCILPAFGAYAGGLNICDPAFGGLFQTSRAVHVLGRERVFAVSPRSCSPDH